MKQRKILHLFSQYLPLTMSWAYLLLKHTPDVQPFIAAFNFQKNDFEDPKFQFWPNPRYARSLRFLNQLSPTLLNLFFRKSKLYDLSLKKFCQTQEIELIHAHFGNIGADYFRLAKPLGIPFIVSFYGFDYGRVVYAKPKYKALYKRMFAQAQAIICEGPYGGQQLIKMGCPQEKIHIIHLGIEVEKIPFSLREKRPKHLKMVQVASFEERKGHIDAVEAFARISEECPGLSLDFYGPLNDPVIVQEVKEKIVLHQLQEKVSIRPSIRYEQLHAVLQGYDIILQPSKHTAQGGCEGGAPIILLDAQATGMPAIATQHCDIPSEVLHGKSGLLAPESNSVVLASYMKQFYQMGAKEYQAYSISARQHVEKHYAVTACSRSVKQLYDGLIRPDK